jgi:hypothetical protein
MQPTPIYLPQHDLSPLLMNVLFTPSCFSCLMKDKFEVFHLSMQVYHI